MESDIEQADRIMKTHARIAPFLGLLVLLAHNAVFFSWDEGALAWWQIAIWFSFIAVMTLILVTNGALFVPKRVRELANDEVTRRNRSIAMHAGFLVAMIMAVLFVVISPFDPIGGQRAGHMLISISLGVTLMVFGLRELKSDAC